LEKTTLGHRACTEADLPRGKSKIQRLLAQEKVVCIDDLSLVRLANTTNRPVYKFLEVVIERCKPESADCE